MVSKPRLERKKGRWTVTRWSEEGGGPHPGGFASYTFKTHEEAYQFALTSYGNEMHNCGIWQSKKDALERQQQNAVRRNLWKFWK